MVLGPSPQATPANDRGLSDPAPPPEEPDPLDPSSRALGDPISFDGNPADAQSSSDSTSVLRGHVRSGQRLIRAAVLALGRGGGKVFRETSRTGLDRLGLAKHCYSPPRLGTPCTEER